MVTLHPETGERQLYVNPDYTSHIVELTRQESDHLLAMLNEHVCSREFTVRFQWRPGSIAFWDNRATAPHCTRRRDTGPIAVSWSASRSTALRSSARPASSR